MEEHIRNFSIPGLIACIVHSLNLISTEENMDNITEIKKILSEIDSRIWGPPRENHNV